LGGAARAVVIGVARPTRTGIFSAITVNYTLVLNVAGLAVFAALFGLTIRRGATDPVCGMTVDRATAVTATAGGRTFYFCSEHCRQAFLADPDRYSRAGDHPPRRHHQRDHGLSTL
jgi:YHS domain-containing protein